MPNPAASRDSKRCARGFRFEEGGLEASYVLARHRATLIVVGRGPTRAIAGCTSNPGASSPTHRSLGTHGCLSFALDGCFPRGLKVHPPMARPSRLPPSKLHFSRGVGGGNLLAPIKKQPQAPRMQRTPGDVVGMASILERQGHGRRLRDVATCAPAGTNHVC